MHRLRIKLHKVMRCCVCFESACMLRRSHAGVLSQCSGYFHCVTCAACRSLHMTDVCRCVQVTYSLWLGADLKLFSTAKAEQHLKNMHEPNHRELRISKWAGRVADVLWPGCQENIDEAIAKHKVMVSKTRVHIPEPEYEPPQVPHLLPFTSWCATRLADNGYHSRCDSSLRPQGRLPCSLLDAHCDAWHQCLLCSCEQV